MNDNCKCPFCTVRRRVEAQLDNAAAAAPGDTGEAQGRSDLDIERDLAESQANLNRAQTVSILVTALGQAENMGQTEVVDGIRRALVLVLPEAPKPEAPVQENPETAVEEQPFVKVAPEDVPAEILAMAKAMAAELGVEVQIMGYHQQ